ncbi:MAG: integrase [Cocleimonas sp.]|jgi:integrase
MLQLVNNLEFKADFDFVTKDSPCFKSLNYPPTDDFVMSINPVGDVVSKYGDDIWDFSSFGLFQKLQFGEYDEVNKALFKQLMYYVIYSHLYPGKYNSLSSWYGSFQNVFRVCSESKISASEISRFPRVIEEMAQSYAKRSPSSFNKSIWQYDVILKNKDHIGFTLLNERSIAVFIQFDPKYENGQTPYIPNRIWTIFIQYLDSVLDDFETYQDKLESLFHYLTQTILLNESKGIRTGQSSPFMKGRAKDKTYYEGTFEEYLSEVGLLSFFEKYSERPKKVSANNYKIDQLGSLLNNVIVSCYLYTLYYSIMRKNEAASLRIDCLKIENDEQTGKFYLLAGETTKTDADSDARWIVSKRVEKAVRIAKTLVDWKIQYVTTADESPYLFQSMNVWQLSQRKSEARTMKSFDNFVAKAPKFFKPKQFQITQKDYAEAIALTPSLINQDWFKVDGFWNFAYHQFRRTLAVHFALNKVSVSSTQLQMKHGTREQQFHYQNNAGRLRLNRLAEQEVVNEYYVEMARNIFSVVNDEQILPHKKSPVKQDVICFVENGDIKKLQKAQKNGAVGYRKNLLGGCMKQGTCEYGGFDSITHCAGGEGGNMCSDLVIDGTREQEFREDKEYLEREMDGTKVDSPKDKALKAEVSGYKNVLEVIQSQKVDKK